MSFDPFGDFATEGYLRNVEKEKDLDIVKRLEHTSFTTGLDEAFTALGKSRQFSYSDVLRTHGILFNAVYPWAGQDRLSIAPALSVRKGPVIFANPSEIRPAVEFALRKAQEKDYLRAHPGEIMGHLAFGHPRFPARANEAIGSVAAFLTLFDHNPALGYGLGTPAFV